MECTPVLPRAYQRTFSRFRVERSPYQGLVLLRTRSGFAGERGIGMLLEPLLETMLEPWQKPEAPRDVPRAPKLQPLAVQPAAAAATP